MLYRIAFLLCCAALTAQVIPPAYYSANRRHVANNLNTLTAQGLLTTGLANAVANISGLNADQRNQALDQMHPAPYSDLVEIQSSIGGQLLSLFHRKPVIQHSYGKGNWRAWVDPMGNWLREGNLGEQTGFTAQTLGVAAGIDRSLGKNWSLGGGLDYNQSDLKMHHSRGSGMVKRYLAALYTDFNRECFYCGISLYGGWDENNITRRIFFPSIDLTAKGHFSAIDIGGQFEAAYLFGFPYCLLYPYANVDYFYYRGKSISEKGADGLNLTIGKHSSQTLRSSAGIGLKLQDANASETICIVPTVAFAWTMECPIERPAYTAHFAGESLTFDAKGWNRTWQLLCLDFELALYIYDFVFAAEYMSESSPSTVSDYWSQRCNLKLEYSW